MDQITWDDFTKIDMRVGTIVAVSDFPEARQPAYKLNIDFGPLGIKKSSAQLTKLYSREDLLQQQIIAVINFHPKQIANFFSECLVLGLLGDGQEVTLLQPERDSQNGQKVG